MNTQTGPTTPAGKAVSKMNAVKHGLRSTAVVLPGLEIEADWNQFLRDTMKAFKPVGAVEYALADRIATLFWRLRRAARAERDAAIILGRRQQLGVGEDGQVDPQTGMARGILDMVEWAREVVGFKDDPESPPPPLPPIPLNAPAVLPAPGALETLSKYESRLSRQLTSALHELQALQDRRQGRAAPLVRVGVEGLPDEV